MILKICSYRILTVFVSLLIILSLTTFSDVSEGFDFTDDEEFGYDLGENETVNVTDNSYFTVDSSNCEFEFGYDIVSYGRGNLWVKENLFHERIIYHVEFDYGNDSNDYLEFEFSIDYFDDDISDLWDDTLVWSDVVIYVETSDNSGYLSVDDFEYVDYSLLRDSFYLSSDVDIENIYIYQNPTYLYKLDVYIL